MAWWHLDKKQPHPRTLPEELVHAPEPPKVPSDDELVYKEAKASYNAKVKRLEEELTQPENPYEILKIEWDPQASAGGFKVFKVRHQVYEPRYIWYSLSQSLSQRAVLYTEAENEVEILPVMKPLSPTLFPTFETAEAWLKSFINGPEKVIYDPQGNRVS